eukprot:jgi/Ulvmu1/6269/UM028_0127.1
MYTCSRCHAQAGDGVSHCGAHRVQVIVRAVRTSSSVSTASSFTRTSIACTAMSLDCDMTPCRTAGPAPRAASARRSQSAGKPPLAHSYTTPKRPATVGAVSGQTRRNNNDLQTYATMLEHHLHDRRREMIVLAAEKRKLELTLKQRRNLQEQTKFGDLFDGKESLDLPAKMRAIVEDNRALKDRARRLKADCAHWHRVGSELSAQNQLMQAQMIHAKQQLAECSITVEEMEELREQLNHTKDLERQVRVLTSENHIMRHKMDADALRLRQEKSSAKREQHKLASEIRKLNSESHTKALQIQCLRTQIKEEQGRLKRLFKQRRRADSVVEASALAECDRSGCHGNVHVMLCVITQATEAGSCSTTAPGASAVQGRARQGHAEEQAAVQIQAAFRGHRARTHCHKMWRPGSMDRSTEDGIRHSICTAQDDGTGLPHMSTQGCSSSEPGMSENAGCVRRSGSLHCTSDNGIGQPVEPVQRTAAQDRCDGQHYGFSGAGTGAVCASAVEEALPAVPSPMSSDQLNEQNSSTIAQSTMQCRSEGEEDCHTAVPELLNGGDWSSLAALPGTAFIAADRAASSCSGGASAVQEGQAGAESLVNDA